jgi:hypothetical protein
VRPDGVVVLPVALDQLGRFGEGLCDGQVGAPLVLGPVLAFELADGCGPVRPTVDQLAAGGADLPLEGDLESTQPRACQFFCVST